MSEHELPPEITRTLARLRETEARQHLMLGLLRRQRETSDPQEIMRLASEAVGQYLQVDRAGFFEVQDENIEFCGGWTSGHMPLRSSPFPASGVGAGYLAEVRSGRTARINDARTDPLTADSVFPEIGTVAVIGVPIIRKGLWHAGFYVNHSQPRVWTDDEIALAQDVGEQTWDAVERTTASAALRKSEERLTLALEAGGGVGAWDWDIPTNTVHTNTRFAELFSLGPERAATGIPGSEFQRRLAAENGAGGKRKIEQLLETGGDFAEEYRIVEPDGTVRWLYARGRCHLDGAGNPARFPGVVFDITERKQAEADLRQQWQTFDTVLSNTPDFAYVFDLNGRFTYVNRALLLRWGKPFDEVSGKNFLDLGYPSEMAERLAREIQQVITTMEPIRGDQPYALPDGKMRFYEYIFVPVLGPDGHVEAVAGSTRDVTERKEAADLIEDDRRRWRELLLQAPAAIAIVRGPEHRFEWVNTEYVRLVDKPEETLIGKPAVEIFPEFVEQGFFDLVEHVYGTGEPYIGHETLFRMDRGGGVWQDFYINFVYIATRNVSGEIDGIFLHATDVTEMVLARQRIEERERQLRALAESIPQLAWMGNENGELVWFNRRWYEYTGTRPEQVENGGWQTLLDSDVLPKVLERWKESVATGEPFEMIHPLKGAKGENRSFLTRIEPVKDTQGRVVRWFGTATDITEQRRIEEELRRVNRDLEEFAYIASHDIQEPLRMVKIYTQLLLGRMKEKGLGDDAALNDYAGFVEEGVNRMGGLIHDLLSFLRLVHEQEQAASTADLSASLAEAVSVLKNRIEETDAVIKAGWLPHVRGDTSQMAHVFQNLLSNALKYRKNHVRPEINVDAAMTREGWSIRVRDNGIGFEPQHAAQIFGLFERLHKGDYPGTGLGLTICKRIVERYGGRIWAQGSPGEGATFFFSIPDAQGQ